MEKVKIYPYLIDKSRLSGYYEILFDEGYDLKRFEKRQIRQFMIGFYQV